ncbi:SoxR reducing system RseC family protein [Thermodesulfobacteriota bacterium]
MNTEQGIIEKLMGEKAMVRINQRSACAGCGSREGCEISGNDAHIEVINDIHAGIGDQVELSVPEGTVLKLSLLIYFIPVIALIIGAFAGDAIANKLQTDTTLPAIIGGGVFMGTTFCFLRRLDRSSELTKKYQPRIEKIITNQNQIQTNRCG